MHTWWLRQLGIFALRDKKLPFQLKIGDATARKIVDATTRVIRNTRLDLIYEWEIPVDQCSDLTTVVPCELCTPLLHGELVGTIAESTLKLHRVGSRCGAAGFPVSRRLQRPPSHYFLIEATSRLAMGVEILAVFKQFKVDIANMVGRKMGAGWAVFRIQVDHTDRHRLKQIARKLTRIAGVLRVIEPDQPTIPYLEAPLPPRSLFESSPWALPVPYICGNRIEDDAFFYGMEREIATLLRFFDHAVSPAAKRGVSVFIRGPKRIGKSSLAAHFLRLLEAQSAQKCLSLLYEARRGQGWSLAQEEIGHELLRRAVEQYQVALTLPPGSHLDEIMALIQSRLSCPIVLVIDEAVGLFYETMHAGDKEALLRFYSRVMARPGCLIVWVGPDAALRWLDPELQKVLEHADALEVQGLSVDVIKSLLKAEKLAPKVNTEEAD